VFRVVVGAEVRFPSSRILLHGTNKSY
jgi:hypothetical protein